MSILTLGGVALNPSMRIGDLYENRNVSQSTVRSLGGALKIFHSPLVAGRSITLEAGDDYGWITKAVSDQINEMANVAGATYELNINGLSYTAVFRHNDPPAYTAAPLVYRTAQQEEDLFTCTIKLLTV